jgi:hypothetical protein
MSLKCSGSALLKHFKAKLMCFSILLLEFTYLSACTATETQQARPSQAPDDYFLGPFHSPSTQNIETDAYAKLSSEFLEKINQISDPQLKEQYTAGIHGLHRLAQHDSKNREILKKLVQHQDQTLEIFKICVEKEEFSTHFNWVRLYHSLFWKRTNNSYLVLLMCDVGTSNRLFVPFVYSEEKGKPKFKPFTITRFRKERDGIIQRFESDLGVGRSFPDTSDWFDPVTNELRIWTRLGGGSSPCGTQGTYRFQNDELVLQKFTARFDCDPRKKEDYEQLYP